MANPRKFSEKIALHHQKQAEETAAFEKIMREVSDATNKVGVGSSKNSENGESSDDAGSHGSDQGCSFRTGSLPNVAKQPSVTPPADLEILLIPTCQVNSDTESFFSVLEPEDTMCTQIAPVRRGRTASSVGPMRSRPAERKHDTSPYGSAAYLSPPPADATWRRTNSDSALHQSCSNNDVQPQQPPRQHNQRRSENANLETVLSILAANQNRPRSSCEVPRVPGVNMMSNNDPSRLGTDFQMPGGSLPDLTSLHFRPQHPASPHHNHYDPMYSAGALSPQVHDRPPPYENHLLVPNSNNYPQRHKSLSPLEQSWAAAGYSPPSLHSSHSNLQLDQHKIGSPHNSSGYSPPSLHSSHSNLLPDSRVGLSNSPTPESPHSDYYVSQSALLQPFQQISMIDSPAPQSISSNYPDSSPRHHQHHAPSPHHQQSHAYTPSMRGDPVPAGTTPTGIPDIILTDFSSGSNDCKDLEASLLAGEELRASLDPIDLDGLHLLTDPSCLLPDPTAEDVFRLDRL